jgi:peptidoglycan/xylan/chitin deacetylase (PgdA/CDA1 family)
MNPGILARSFLSAAQRRSIRNGVGIYVWHKVATPPPQTCDPFEYAAPARFRKRLSALTGLGTRCLALDEFGRGAGRSPGFVLTFDDGYANVIENALPILAEFSLKATLYAVAGMLGKTNTWDQAKGDVTERLADVPQLREWIAAGHRLGSHSYTHANLRKLSLAAAREEILGSRMSLEDTFGIPVRHFCYPYGAYTSEVSKLVEECGYLTAVTMKFGTCQPGESPFELARISPLSAGELGRKAWHRVKRKLRFGR